MARRATLPIFVLIRHFGSACVVGCNGHNDLIVAEITDTLDSTMQIG